MAETCQSGNLDYLGLERRHDKGGEQDVPAPFICKCKEYLRLEQFLDASFDLVCFREAVERVLREDLSTVQENFERPGRSGRNGDCAKLTVIIVQQVLRQTGGSWEVASRSAVLDTDCRILFRFRCLSHRCSSNAYLAGGTPGPPSGLPNIARVSHGIGHAATFRDTLRTLSRASG